MRHVALALAATPLVIVPAFVLAAMFAMGFLAALLIPRLLRRWRSELMGIIAAGDLMAKLKFRGVEESKC